MNSVREVIDSSSLRETVTGDEHKAKTTCSHHSTCTLIPPPSPPPPPPHTHTHTHNIPVFAQSLICKAHHGDRFSVNTRRGEAIRREGERGERGRREGRGGREELRASICYIATGGQQLHDMLCTVQYTSICWFGYSSKLYLIS